MKRLLTGLASVLILLAGISAPPADAEQSATTVTLYSWSSSGWASGWHTHTETPAYDSIHVSWTYRGTTGCNSGSDHFLVRILGNDPYDGSSVLVKQDGVWGSMYNSSWSGTFVVTDDDYGYWHTHGYRVSMYVGPQSACSASVRVWEYA